MGKTLINRPFGRLVKSVIQVNGLINTIRKNMNMQKPLQTGRYMQNLKKALEESSPQDIGVDINDGSLVSEYDYLVEHPYCIHLLRHIFVCSKLTDPIFFFFFFYCN